VKKLLYIEDDRALHKLAEKHFAKRGFAVVFADTGEQGLQAAAAGVDAVVVDLGLPGMSGVRVIEALRADERTARIPILVVSGRTDVQDHALALESGADGFHPKPVKWPALEGELTQLLAARESR
jgi:two-component system response regulator PhoP